jgi:hypothetical protein
MVTSSILLRLSLSRPNFALTHWGFTHMQEGTVTPSSCNSSGLAMYVSLP